MSSVLAGTYNTSRVLRLLWLNPGISRIEMADQLGLNRSTVTNIINDLLERELVKAVALGDSSPLGGRKKVQLAINAGYACVGGIQLHADEVRIVLTDLAGRVLHQQTLAGAVNEKNLYRRLEKACEAVQQRARAVRSRLLGIGCGVPGIVDPVRGTLQQSIPLGIMHEEPIARRMADVVPTPIYVDNDANCCCWGELAGTRDPAANFLFVLGEWRRLREGDDALVTAIGIGVVLNRVVHHGRAFSAGEFRSIEWKPGNTSQFSLSDAEIAAARHDRRLFLTMVRELARNAAMVVHVLDLDRLYLGGFFDARDLELREIFAEEIRRNWTYPTPPTCEVAFSSHGDSAVAYGAAGLILQRAFGDPGAFAYTGHEPGIGLLVGA